MTTHAGRRVRTTAWLLLWTVLGVGLGVGLGLPARAQSPAEGALTPPVLVESVAPVFPAALREGGPYAGAAAVEVTVDAEGRVVAVAAVEADHPLFGEALRGAVTGWRFTPARLEGEAVAVVLPVRWSFVAPPVAVRGRLVRRGVRAAVVGVAARLEPAGGGAERVLVSDIEGRLEGEVPPGRYVLRVDDPAVEAMARAVEVGGEAVDLGEIELTPSAAFDAALVVRARREEGSTRLDAAELRTTAGSLGDPLRVLQSLPSVGTYVSLAPFPIVRGSPPGDNAITVDGTRIPLLFHSGAGLSVIPPAMIGAIDFYPGIAPLRLGRFTGGAIEVVTRDPVEVGWMGELSVDIGQAGAMLSAPVGEGGRLTAAGRLSYTGWVLDALDQPVVVDFADYHARYTWRGGRWRARVTLFGATDTFGDARVAELTDLAFHRLAVRIAERRPSGLIELGVDLGLERTAVPAGDLGGEFVLFRSEAGGTLEERLLHPRLRIEQRLADVTLEVGIEALFTAGERGGRPIGEGRVGAWVEARWAAGPWTVTPGARVDLYEAPQRAAVDPRIDVRLAVSDALAVVARLGQMSGPQRPDWPLPGADELSRDTLQVSRQASVGIEQALDAGFEVSWTLFGSHTEHLPSSPLDRGAAGLAGQGEITEQEGRSLGSDLLIRRRPGGWWSGWLAYTAQRVERRAPWGEWLPGALEQQHIVNAVLTLRLPDRWLAGGRFHYTSGRIAAPGSRARLPGYAQLDLRVEKGWVFDHWTLTAYLDVVNVTRSRETTRGESVLQLDPDDPDGIDFFLPMLGLRGRF